MLAKLESFNPHASVKDRIGLSLIVDAEKAARFVRQNSAHRTDRRQHGDRSGIRRRGEGLRTDFDDAGNHEPGAAHMLLKALGAGACPDAGPQRRSERRYHQGRRTLAATPTGYILQQFDNPANPKIHFGATGARFWNDTDGEVDILILRGWAPAELSRSQRDIRPKKPSFKAPSRSSRRRVPCCRRGSSPHKIRASARGSSLRCCGRTTSPK